MEANHIPSDDACTNFSLYPNDQPFQHAIKAEMLP
jgi:hypothetical protein